MLRAIKSYWAFTNDLYKWVMLVFVPIILIVSNSVLSNVWAEADYVFLSSLLLLYVADTMSDIFFMGGFYHENNGALEFLQSTPRFQEFMREVGIIDIVRRVLIYQVPFVTALVCAWENEERMEWCIRYSYFPLLETLIAMLVVLVARHWVLWNQAYVCTVIGYVAIIFSYWLLDVISNEPSVIVNGILVVCVLLAGVGTVWYTREKVRDSYYDA